MGLFKDNFTLLKKASEPLYKTPKSVQQTIEIMKISECGIFEVAVGRYSKTYRFSDVNYATRTENEQESFFQRYCKGTIYFRKAQEKSVFSQILQYIYTILLAYLEYLL